MEYSDNKEKFEMFLKLFNGCFYDLEVIVCQVL